MPRSILAFAFGLGLATAAQAGVPDRPAPPPATDNAVLRWNAALLEAVRAVRLAPPMTARALAIAHSCMFDAWAAYDDRADGTRFGGSVRRPKPERTLANKAIAVSYAAHRALSDLFPTQLARFDATLRDLGLDPRDGSTDVVSPAGIGHTVCDAVLAVRHADGANQLGDLTGGAPYSDYTGYGPVNDPEHLHDPARWQPLRGADGTAQVFLAPHWRHVVPFALATADEFRPQPPAMPGSAEYMAQADEIRAFSAQLTDRGKAIAEYWADGPATETPPGHWALLASWVSRRDRHGLDDDVVLFFALGNALLDASIAVWDAKVFYDYVRPVSAVRHVFAQQTIEAWGGPFQRTRLIAGEQFRPYIATPPFAEYASGHSAFSAAAATVLRLFTGSPRFGATVVIAPGTSAIEPGVTPAAPVVLSWRTFDDAADEAGLSRRLGGIHFRDGDLASRAMGKAIGRRVFREVLRHTLGMTQVSR
jgi:PAP2 superfamily